MVLGSLLLLGGVAVFAMGKQSIAGAATGIITALIGGAILIDKLIG